MPTGREVPDLTPEVQVKPDKSHPQSVLLAFIESDYDDTAVAELEQIVTDISGSRDWVIQPPKVVDITDNEEEGMPTVGVLVRQYKPYSNSGEELSLEVELSLLEEVRALVASLGPFSLKHELEILFEIDDDFVGSIEQGQPDELLTMGLIGEWEAHLAARRDEA